MLWIRTQNKEELIKPDNISYVEFEGKHCIGLGIGYIFGEYATKERALEVLDEIQEYLQHDCIDRNFVATIFEMPKD